MSTAVQYTIVLIILGVACGIVIVKMLRKDKGKSCCGCSLSDCCCDSEKNRKKRKVKPYNSDSHENNKSME